MLFRFDAFELGQAGACHTVNGFARSIRYEMQMYANCFISHLGIKLADIGITFGNYRYRDSMHLCQTIIHYLP